MKKYHHFIWNKINVAHIAEHHVLPEEAEEACFYDRPLILRGRGKNVYYALGQTHAGRYLCVILRDYGKGIGKPITARDMSDNERRRYKQMGG